MSLISPLLEVTFPLILLYLTWAVVLSDSRFHRVWSLALSVLLFLATQLFDQPFSASRVPLAILVLLFFVICIILSPAQLLLFHTKITGPKKKALEIVNPNTKADYSVDIVFVHGLKSNLRTGRTSRSPSNNVTTGSSRAMWLRDWLLTEEDLNARIMAFNHNTSWNAYALDKSLHDHGDDLLRALETERQDEAMHRPIIFIGHSFGGLIIKQALVTAGADSTEAFHRSVRQKACGFIFLGTPHKGARITLPGEIVSFSRFWGGSSTSLLEVTKPESAINQSLHNDFMSYLQSDGPKTKNTVCVFEAVKQMFCGIAIINVVDKNSAIIDGSHKIGFETDHRKMQRISDQEDERYQEILGWIRRWVKKAKAEAEIHHNAKAREKTREQQECLKSLHFPGMDKRGHDIKDAAFDTCTWLLKHKDYKNWLAQPQALLCVLGKPGAGKSTLIRHALREASHSNHVVASFFFFGRGIDLQKSSCGLFRSLLYQLLDHFPEMLSGFSTLYKKKRDTEQKSESSLEWHERELREFLERWIPTASKDRPIRIYVDALDEAGEDIAIELVKFFKRLTSRPSPTGTGFRICFSCRHYPVLAPKDALTICVEGRNHRDIATYVGQSLKDHFLDAHEADKAQLEQEIIEKASSVFQWAVLIISMVVKLDEDGDGVEDARDKIRVVPSELSDLYEHILSQITDQKKTVQLMQWICFAFRPLSLEELRLGMMMDVTNSFRSLKECQSSKGFAKTDGQMRKKVISLSGGLAETVNYRDRQTVRFIHQSVKDYLTCGGLQKLDTSFFHDVNHYLSQHQLQPLDTSMAGNAVGLAHFRISRSCVKYSTLEEVLEGLKRIKRSTRAKGLVQRGVFNRFPFLKYTVNWALHAEIVEKLQIPQSDLLLLFRWPRGDVILFLEEVDFGNEVLRGATLLGNASVFGLVSVIEAMIMSGVSFDFNERNLFGKTPLSLAAEEGHEAVVQLLIDHPDVDKNSRDRTGQTPLSCAAIKGHAAVVRLLIEQEDVEIDMKDYWGGNLISKAAYCGHKVIVELLKREFSRRRKRLEG